ncbi:hypothetical protein ABIB40_003589 [Pedobacter sp. UYP30]
MKRLISLNSKSIDFQKIYKLFLIGNHKKQNKLSLGIMSATLGIYFGAMPFFICKLNKLTT